MKLFLLNLLLAFFWAAVSGTFSPASLVVGFVLGYAVLLLVRPAFGPSAYYAGLWRGLAFAAFYVWELILSSVRVAFDVLTPRLRARPGIITLPTDARTDAEITVLANLISLTPGTLTLDVSSKDAAGEGKGAAGDAPRTLLVHAMYLDDGADALRADLREDLEERVLRLFRPAAASSALPPAEAA